MLTTDKGISRADGIFIYLVSLQTPRGITTMACFNSAEHFYDSIPQFRAIRDTITPPS